MLASAKRKRVKVAGLEPAGLIVQRDGPLAREVEGVLRSGGAEAAATGGVGFSDVVHGLGPGVIGEEGETGADTLVGAQAHAVVLGAAVARLSLMKVFIPYVLLAL